MTIQEALEIKKALVIFEDVLDIEAQKLVSLLNIQYKEQVKKIFEAKKIWENFESLDLIERGKLFGINIKYKEN